jgi:hypothetical protein
LVELEEQFLIIYRARLETVRLGWGAIKKEIIKIWIFQAFGHFDSIEKAKNLKKLNFLKLFAR